MEITQTLDENGNAKQQNIQLINILINWITNGVNVQKDSLPQGKEHALS